VEQAEVDKVLVGEIAQVPTIRQWRWLCQGQLEQKGETVGMGVCGMDKGLQLQIAIEVVGNLFRKHRQGQIMLHGGREVWKFGGLVSRVRHQQ
jgi:hypothetical protein